MAAEGASQLSSVVALLGAAVVAIPLFKRLGLGSVLGYLAAGLAIGPFGLGLFHDPQAIIHVAEFGVVMFLFVIGLEMKPSHLWSLRHQIFGLGSMQVILAAFILTLVGMAFGFAWQIAFVGAAGFVLTSTAIVMQVLGERNELNSPSGQRMVSILLFEDLLIVPLLAIVAFLAPADPSHVAGDTSVLKQLGLALLSLAALVIAGLYLLNPLFRILAKTKAREVMTAAALLVVLGAALLMEMGGLSMAMGAFVAGVLLSESSFRHQLEADIEPFRGLLLGLFFLGVGMALDLNVVAANYKLILSGVIALMTAKAVVIYVVARIAKSNHADALNRAVMMAQGGEFAFVLFSAAASQGVITATINANMTAVVVLSMAITPVMIMLHQRFAKAAQASMDGVDNLEAGDKKLKGNVLIIGFGRVGQIASQAPIAYGADISIIDNNPDVVRGAAKYGFKVYYGDGSREDVLHAAGAYQAKCVLVCINDSEATTRIVENVKHHCPTVKVIVRANDREHALHLVQADADFVIRETFEAAMLMGNETIKQLGADELQAEDICDQVRKADHERFALELSGNEFAGRDLLLKNTQ
ncbi:monovalent cation:proton antiporter-2 (CPA2) family protein [Moraxella cuniculi]|uniref:NEM-activable K(+)/H(+) antiporter n=1 Tax=Moraxella cuniculi TaxID=34061 RepID=A0A448GWK8_9GAMM|nr:monovalent cation:proton antiporter-2 (CPA2) family protein [Moraxella cuniculi]VEG13121.1 NEM-activable K(+)/H(+) antiporter [Moraxella cuniculi]